MCIRDRGVMAHVCHEVTAIDPAQQAARVMDHKNGRLFTDHWDKLIITTGASAVSYTHLRAHETVLDLVCRLLLEKKTSKTVNTASSQRLRAQPSAITPLT